MNYALIFRITEHVQGGTQGGRGEVREEKENNHNIVSLRHLND